MTTMYPPWVKALLTAAMAGGVGLLFKGAIELFAGAQTFGMRPDALRAAAAPLYALLAAGTLGAWRVWHERTDGLWLISSAATGIGLLALALGTLMQYGPTGRGGGEWTDFGLTIVVFGAILTGAGHQGLAASLWRRRLRPAWVGGLPAALGLLIIPSLIEPRLFAPLYGLVWIIWANWLVLYIDRLTRGMD